ncbi:MAG: ABC transporter substrate-binding protein [Desulfobacterales bacterium]|nr:ABC transporter substrate-binding protein [Desulfobacterales bacterium]
MHTTIDHRRRCGLILFLGLSLCLLAGAPALAAGPPPLRIALLPIIDSLPFYVAEEQKFFEAAGVQVKAVNVASAAARDQLMQSGQIDGMLNEIISSANFNRDRPQVVVVAVVRAARPGYPLFRLLAAPGSPHRDITDLAGVPIGISRHTVIEYVTDRLLQNAGLPPERIRKQSVPAIPERYQLLVQGHLAAAMLPDPLAMSAIEAGAVLVADDDAVADYSLSILTFALTAMEAKHDQIQGFITAWQLAAAAINAEPRAFRSLMLAKIRIPPNVRDSFRIPPFAHGRVPSADQWQDAMNWMQARELLAAPLPYSRSVTDRFIRSVAADRP